MLTLPLLALAMGHMIPESPIAAALSIGGLNWIQLALASPVVLWCGWPFFERGWASVVNRSLNMFTLIALGTGVAYMYSVVATPGARGVPGAFRNAEAKCKSTSKPLPQSWFWCFWAGP